MTPAVHRAWAAAATLVVAAAVAYGFWVVGTPEARRGERMDDRRIEHLQAIAAEMRERVWDSVDRKLKRELYADLEALKADARQRRLILEDPVTGGAYGYRVIDEYRFELCATFDGPRDEDWQVFWNHAGGARCWTIDLRDAP